MFTIITMAVHPSETKTGTIQLPSRPMIGEEVQIEGEWEKIKTIRHSEKGMHLFLVDKYQKR